MLLVIQLAIQCMAQSLNFIEGVPAENLAKQLFKQVVSSQNLQAYSRAPSQTLKKIIKESSKLFHRKLLKKPQQILLFLTSYHEIISTHSDKIPYQIINNLALHFILLSSYSLIAQKQIALAKNILKKALNYLDSTEPDPILLSTALNNLCVLWMDDQKYYKTINVLLQVSQIMQAHLLRLKKEKNKGQAMQDSVFLINAYYLLCKSLQKVQQKNKQSFYKELYTYSSQNGLKKAIKYMGKQSFLTKRFIALTQKDNDLRLPIYKESPLQKTTYQQKLFHHLLKIEQMLLHPRQSIIVKQEAPPPALPAIQPKDLVYQCSRMINNWHVEVQLIKEKDEKMGSLIFNCKRGKDSINMIIPQQKLQKLLTQMNIMDILAQECNLYNLTPKELVQNCIINFVYIDDNKNLQIFPRATNYITTFFITLFQKQSIMFFYHIRHRQFRIAFGFKDRYQTYYLHTELNEDFINTFFSQFTHNFDQRIQKISKFIMENKGEEHTSGLIQTKPITVKPDKIRQLDRFLKLSLEKFQNFVKSMKSDNNSHIFTPETQYFSFFQTGNPQWSEGRFYFVRYLKGIRGFEINIENNYKTHSPEGKVKAKGQILYSSYQFFRDFGIASSAGVKNLLSFSKILCQKYCLRSYDKPLTSLDRQIYQQNSISEAKIGFKTYLRKMIQHNGIIFPITACVVSVNNKIPVGVKISGYNPISCYEVGFFIHVDHELWRWSHKPIEQEQDYLNKVIEQYAYKKQFFLVEWLERIGFRDILNLLKLDRKDAFFMEGLQGSFYRMINILYTIN